MIRLTGPNRGMLLATSCSRSTHSNAPETMAWRRMVWRSVSVPEYRPPSAGRRRVATQGHCLYGVSRLNSTALARKSSRSSTNLAPRLTASWSSTTTILCRVRPITTSTRSTPSDMLNPSALHLAGFLVHDVLADDRVVLPQGDPLLGVVPVLLGEVAVAAGLALEFDGRAGF